MFYIPGLVYALLITSHLGLGMQLDVMDCGGEITGMTIRGCEKRKTEGLCNDATVPDRRGKNNSLIPACLWEEDAGNPYGGICKDTIIRSSNYNDMISGEYQLTEDGGSNNQEQNMNYYQTSAAYATDKDTKGGFKKIG